ncbi:YeiH family protein [Halarsenatibacter silvermanii]|uniref:Conserved hypothetical integral membrane protein n=1 Tax=Halarsenatibacter silvermanii TaxID=321763 RepID=A0A1G9N1E7_9FIRM|nr:putative sulfate exporter family transporter [Halarsenatibacter silvermanii]SDL80396.1 conserved hypothetical integral membrane protein [Halarsenatibacter silvermanii]
MKKYIPGLLLLLVISIIAIFIAGFLPEYVGSVFIAILIGILINNTVNLNKAIFGPGISLGLKKILKIAIVLLGGTISLQKLATVGVRGLFVILVIIGLAFILTFILGRILNISLKKKILIAAGLSICGNTAIVTTAPLIEAEDRDIFTAVSIVTLFGVLAVFVYPFMGMAAGISDTVFGAWAGTAINDTSQVVAAGFIFSEEAGRIAAMIKLARNVLMAPVILIVGYFYGKRQKEKKGKINILEIFPAFILGFLFLIILNSLGIITENMEPVFDQTSQFLILLALAGIGLEVKFKDLKKVGVKPFIVGFSVAISMAAVSILISGTIF